MNRVALTTLTLLIACGDVPRGASSPQGSGGGADTEAVEIHGTVAAGGPDLGKLLVFAYANMAGRTAPGAADPTSLSNVSADRSFSLSSVPPGDATILFLIDAKSDGVIDPGDTVAVLDDPEHALVGLRAGDEVLLQDITIDATHGKAAAVSITVKRAAGAGPH